MSDDNADAGECSPTSLTEEQLHGPLVVTDAPEEGLVDEKAEPVPDEISYEGWVGNGPPLTGGPGRFHRYSACNVDIHKLPEMSCAPGIPEAWKLRSVGYSRSKEKVPSAKPLYEFIGAELISSPNPLDRISSRTKLPPAPEFDCGGLPHTLVFNLQLPDCEKPGLFGQGLGGKTVNAPLVFRLRREVAEALSDQNSDIQPAVKLLRRFITKLSPEVSKTQNDDFLGRMKLLVRSADGVPSAFAKYNGKPVLVTGSGRFVKTDSNVLEVAVNMRSWAYPARLALYSNWDRLNQYRLHVGMCIEGRADDELNERLLGCCMLALPTLVQKCPPFTGSM
eukprot:TRINITY_DN21158_c3_g1_i1.p1 TRINITY_DN21158_c3_g1~~TRINITY_DN21158_c3_g1_i1.p1  ORF type:complete len:336 (+),score=87.81 TRINITY_DN21158_c3_g1_i1:307-1314(+)